MGLGGLLRRLAGTGPFAAVLLPNAVPASSVGMEVGSYRLLDNLADYLLSQALATLHLDDRGVGRSAALGERALLAGATAVNATSTDALKIVGQWVSHRLK